MGEFLGPYELRGELGRGAMAIVWRGFDPKLEREVAIKEAVIPATADAQMAAELGERFVREGKAAAALNHPGIVTIHAADIYDSRPCIVMELIEGSTLTDILAGGPMTPGAAAAVLDQLLDAVGYAHSKGVVHRDLKPDNVFLTADGRVKLADFGIAHVGEGTALTHAGTIMGTPGYMAPEQVTGLPTDARADIFAIGVIGYELLTGHNPFGATSGDAPTTVMYRIVHEDAPDPVFSVAGLDPHLGAVIRMAMAKHPDARFGSAAAMRAAIAGGPLQPGPPPAGAATVIDGSAQTVIVGAPGGVAVAPAPYPVPVAQPKSGSSALPYVLVGVAGLVIIAVLMVVANNRPAGSGANIAQGTAATQQGGAQQAAAPTKQTPVDIKSYANNAHASTELPPTSKGTYYAANVIDGDKTTCWSEGIDTEGDYSLDPGIGEWVEVEFSKDVVLTQIDMINGYAKQADYDVWGSNGRVGQAQIMFSDGTVVNHTFADQRTSQSFVLPKAVKTSSVRIVIGSAYEPSASGSHPATYDTSISELGFKGWVP